MWHVRQRFAQISSAALLTTITAAPQAYGEESPEPLRSPEQAASLANELGADRTGGVYLEEGNIVVTVTDQAAAESVRDAGGTPRMVTRSAAQLESIHHKLDELEHTPHTSWGVDASTNQVSVEIFNGASSDTRDRIKRIAAAHTGAISVNEIDSNLIFKATDLRGGDGIRSEGGLCSAGFNTVNSAGAYYTLTAGHCTPRTGVTWYAVNGGAKIGTQNAYNFGTGTTGKCDSSTRACDWATIKVNGPVTPRGTVRYGNGDYRQITKSRYPMEKEKISRTGTVSRDTTGHITKTSVTVNIEGQRLYGMFESTVCALGGDSGGPAHNGTTALGLLSGGTSETVCNSSSSGTYRNYFTKVQTVLNERGLRVF
ncbi:S1 family peptidase [Streptomyces sindenensis]|uniref:S1 family peptidase n=1 Tax=Streptomyces sindenensis TaxID=67363 RepID=UPI001678E7AC|nr:S1 family peptidase [Streptomyces sindenensis]GGP81892.1 peptidase [Streptomyces sindenensis]